MKHTTSSTTAIALLLACGCHSTTTFDEVAQPDGGAAITDAMSEEHSDAGFSLQESGPMRIPVRKIPGLVSITYYETTGAVMAYTFMVNGPEMTTKVGTLTSTNADIQGASTEYYDVYYSDDQGVFDVDGSYLTIAGVYLYAAPAGGGLNLAEIALVYMGQPAEYGNYIASYVALGDNAIPGDVAKAIDGNLMTCTTMGNTVNDPGKLLRITLGFESSSGPPK